MDAEATEKKKQAQASVDKIMASSGMPVAGAKYLTLPVDERKAVLEAIFGNHDKPKLKIPDTPPDLILRTIVPNDFGVFGSIFRDPKNREFEGIQGPNVSGELLEETLVRQAFRRVNIFMVIKKDAVTKSKFRVEDGILVGFIDTWANTKRSITQVSGVIHHEFAKEPGLKEIAFAIVFHWVLAVTSKNPELTLVVDIREDNEPFKAMMKNLGLGVHEGAGPGKWEGKPKKISAVYEFVRKDWEKAKKLVKSLEKSAQKAAETGKLAGGADAPDSAGGGKDKKVEGLAGALETTKLASPTMEAHKAHKGQPSGSGHGEKK